MRCRSQISKIQTDWLAIYADLAVRGCKVPNAFKTELLLCCASRIGNAVHI